MNTLQWLVSSPAVYSTGAGLYRWLTTHELQADVFAEIAGRIPGDGRTLDVCCGPAVLGRRLGAARGAPASVCVDMAQGALRLAEGAGLRVRASATALPFADGAFAAAVISGALYLVEDPVAVLREMARVARRVVALEASPQVDLGAVLGRRGALPLKARADFLIWVAAMRLRRRFDPDGLQRLLRQAGLRDVAVRSLGRGFYLLAEGQGSAPAGAPGRGAGQP